MREWIIHFFLCTVSIRSVAEVPCISFSIFIKQDNVFLPILVRRRGEKDPGTGTGYGGWRTNPAIISTTPLTLPSSRSVQNASSPVENQMHSVVVSAPSVPDVRYR
jgi:hypothetical protein